MSLKDFNIKVNDLVVIEGQINWSQLVDPYEGEALKKRKEFDQFAPEKPYREISIKNPKIIKNQNEPLAKYFLNDRFFSMKNGETGFNHRSTSPFKPPFYLKKVQDGKQVLERIKIENELATDQNITVVFKTFDTSRQDNPIGISLHSVILEEDFSYKEDSVEKDLNELGYVLNNEEDNHFENKACDDHSDVQEEFYESSESIDNPFETDLPF